MSLINRAEAIDQLHQSINLLEAEERIKDMPSAVDCEHCIFAPFKGLPSANQWIPCAERLPEGEVEVLATTIGGYITIAERCNFKYINSPYWFIHEGNSNADKDEVIAWMPLPQPLKGDE